MRLPAFAAALGPHPRQFWASLDRQSRLLYACVAVSILLHAILLAVHFRLPDALRWRAPNQTLDVVLVNAKTKERPSKSKVLAQSNLDRGGDTDENRRASTPLPVLNPREPGTDLAEAQRRVEQLEAEQRALLAQARAARERVAPSTPRTEQTPEAQAQPRGRDLADQTLAALRLEAEINRRLEAYQKRPRKKFIGASAAEYRFAQYEVDWVQKIERIGTLNYPAEARGKLYGQLRLTVTLRPDGSIEEIELDHSSGLPVLDAAAFRIVRMASPFAPFPSDIRRDTDLVVITRTWIFGQGDKIWTQ